MRVAISFTDGMLLLDGHAHSHSGGDSRALSTLPAAQLGSQTRASRAVKVKVKFSHTRYRALGPELIPVYRQSARR